jgi:hypothetical protein
MWETKFFDSYIERDEWINANKHKYQIHVIFVNNGYAVEIKPLRRVY